MQERHVISAQKGKYSPHTCKPHSWKLPEPGDNQLVCDRCDHSLKFIDEGCLLAARSIINSLWRRHGKPAAARFHKAFCISYGIWRKELDKKDAH